MADAGDVWGKTYFDRATRISIGRALRAQYDLAAPMPARLAELLERLEERERRPAQDGNPDRQRDR